MLHMYEQLGMENRTVILCNLFDVAECDKLSVVFSFEWKVVVCLKQVCVMSLECL